MLIMTIFYTKLTSHKKYWCLFQTLLKISKHVFRVQLQALLFQKLNTAISNMFENEKEPLVYYHDYQKSACTLLCDDQ